MNLKDLNVAIMAYSRAEHFASVFGACEKELSRVKVYLDFPSTASIREEQKKIIRVIEDSPLRTEVHRRTENYGLVRSILTTVEEELKTNDHIVLLEDDCVPQAGFFQFMRNSLTSLKDTPEISTICGTPTRCRFNPWGWATWSHKWSYEKLAVQEIMKIENLDEELKEYLTKHPVDKMIWSLSWLALQYKNNTWSHYPTRCLIENIGLDNTGVHSHEEGYTQWLYSQIVEDLKE